MQRTMLLGEVSEGRENNFDFLRFWFASLVLFYHCYPLLQGSMARQSDPLARIAPVAAGSSVDFFFVISGFLVTASWLRSRTFGQYLRKRILRIYPAFVVVSFFCAFLIGPLGSAPPGYYWLHFHFVKFALYLALLPADVVGPDMSHVFVNLPYPSVIDGSFWTLRYEFELYLVAAALGSFGLFRRPPGRQIVLLLFVMLFVLSAFSGLTAHTFIPDREIPWVGSPLKWLRLATCFLSGMLFYLYRDRIRISPPLFAAAFTAFCLLGLKPSWFTLAVPILGAYVLFSFAFQPSIKLQNFARYGDFSYGMYLYAFPIQQVLVQYWEPDLTPLRLFLIAFPLTLLCAVLSWHLIEAPCLALKNGKQDDRTKSLL
jgi:peptidoglycan/LPS O-acetylase OafA/YrhL